MISDVVKRSFRFLANWKIFCICLAWIVLDEFILIQIFTGTSKFIFPLDQTFIFFLGPILTEISRVFIKPFFVIVSLLSAMNYWENKKINITYAINKVKNYYQKFILYFGIFLVLFIISSLSSFLAMNYVDILVVSIPFFNIIQLVLSFVLFLVPSILIVKNISLKKSLKESWITVRANLTNSIYIFLIGTLASLIVLSPTIIVANLQLMTGKFIACLSGLTPLCTSFLPLASCSISH